MLSYFLPNKDYRIQHKQMRTTNILQIVHNHANICIHTNPVIFCPPYLGRDVMTSKIQQQKINAKCVCIFNGTIINAWEVFKLGAHRPQASVSLASYNHFHLRKYAYACVCVRPRGHK